MTGLDCLRTEMLERGMTKNQINSKIVAVVLDILAQSGTKYSEMWEKEKETSDRLDEVSRELKYQITRLKGAEALMAVYQRTAEKFKTECEECKVYIDEFNKSLEACETTSGRDAMRTAQMYVNSVDIDTKYDNTAFIIGLSAILSRGAINPVDELRKINPKLPSVFTDGIDL